MDSRIRNILIAIGEEVTNPDKPMDQLPLPMEYDPWPREWPDSLDYVGEEDD